MLSYRHSFHAGNYADVLKHIVLVEVLRYLGEKEKPFEYIDTHAGAGIYSLASDQSKKTREYEQGIGLLYTDTRQLLKPYLNVIRQFNAGGRLQFYPGSPKIAESLLRAQDRGWLFELHPSDSVPLQQAFAGNRRFRVAQEDGFKGLLSLLPPATRRACILIDPPYEVKQDYDQVVATVINAHQRFATGIYCIWYPVVERERIKRMEKKLVASGIRRIQRFELGHLSTEEGRGMHATGMIVINPPWTLFAKMEALLPLLVETLGTGQPYQFLCEQWAGE